MSLTENESLLEAYISTVIGPPPLPEAFGLSSKELHEIQNPPPSIFDQFIGDPLGRLFNLQPKGNIATCLLGVICILLLPVTMLYMYVCAFSEGFSSGTRHPKRKQYEKYVKARKIYAARRAQTELNYARTRQDFWFGLGGRGFEEEVADLLRKYGHDVRTTAVSGDEGVDLVVDDSTIVQCKQHAKPVAPAVVRDLAGTRQYFGAKRAILISSRGFTTGATAFAKKVDIELWDVHTLIEMQDELN